MRLARNVIPQMLAEARSIVDVSSVVQRLWQTYGPPREGQHDLLRSWQNLSEERDATIDVDGLSRHGAGSLGTKKQGSLRDFLRGLRAALQQAVQKTGQLLLFAHAHFFREHSAQIFGHLRFRYGSGA